MAKINSLEIIENLYLKKQISKRDYELLKKDFKKAQFSHSLVKRGQKLDMVEVRHALANTYKNPNKKIFNDVAVNHIAKINNILKPVLESPESILKCGNTYFDLCFKDGIKPTVAGLALAIGVKRSTLLNWASGNTRLQNSEVIANLLQRCEAYLETSMMMGQVNPVPALFLAKNNFGYKDESTIKVDSKDKELTDAEIKKKYLDKVEIIDADITEKKDGDKK